MTAKREDWLETAIAIRIFHITKLKENSKWRINDTAKLLKRSHGSVQQYLMIASWLRTHENQLNRFDTMNEALEFIRNKKKELELEV